jgi:hypothetical protein
VSSAYRKRLLLLVVSWSGLPNIRPFLPETPNAAPEWQAWSLRPRSKELVVACPLKGLVRRLENQFLAINLQESLD